MEKLSNNEDLLKWIIAGGLVVVIIALFWEPVKRTGRYLFGY